MLAKRTQVRAAARPKKPIRNLHSGTNGFSRPWRYPAARSNPPAFSALTAGVVRSLPPSMVSTLEGHEDPKLRLVAEVLRCRGNVQMKARGASMLPSLWPGDLLTIQRAARDKVVPGDIVLVMQDSRFFVHRLVEISRDADCLSWITRGDGMPNNDPRVAAPELLGRVIAVSRGNRSFVPSRRASLLNSALAWTLCRWGRLRNLALRFHAMRMHEDLRGVRRLIRGVFSAGPGFSEVPPSRAPLP
jgi:hypothetical protein